MQGVDYLILALLLLWAAAAVWIIRRRKKAGRSLTCGGDCTHCAGSCHPSPAKKPADPSAQNDAL